MGQCAQPTFRQQSATDAHRLKFLEEELVRVRNADLCEIGTIIARGAFEDARLGIHLTKQAARLTDIALEIIRLLHHDLLEKF